MILHLKGNNGQSIHEIDTNLVSGYKLLPSMKGSVQMRDGTVIIIDPDEFEKLNDAMDAPR